VTQLAGRPEAELLDDNRLIVWDPVKARILYNSDFYGKPLGAPRPKEDFDEPLLLDPVEALYLLENKKIKIRKHGKNFSTKKFMDEIGSNFQNFSEKYLVYVNLRKQGYVVTPGIKYGCDFAVYKDGPGLDHAPYIVQIMKMNEEITAAEIVKAGRLATTVRKSFMIAVIDDKDISYLEFNWWKA